MIVTKIIIFLISFPLGIYLVAKAELMVRTFGKNSWAENALPGGSYIMWKLIGIIVIALGFVFMLGGLDWLIYPNMQ